MVLKENEVFELNLESKLGNEILELYILERRAHESRLSRNEKYSRFLMRFESFLIFIQDLISMGKTCV